MLNNVKILVAHPTYECKVVLGEMSSYARLLHFDQQRPRLQHKIAAFLNLAACNSCFSRDIVTGAGLAKAILHTARRKAGHGVHVNRSVFDTGVSYLQVYLRPDCENEVINKFERLIFGPLTEELRHVSPKIKAAPVQIDRLANRMNARRLAA